MKKRKTSRRRRSRVSGLNVRGAFDTLKNDILPGTVGFVAGQVLDKQLSFFADKVDPSKSNIVRNLIKVGGGLLISAMGKNRFLSGMGTGLALNGAAGIAIPTLEQSGLIDPSVNGLGGLLPPGKQSVHIAGVPGDQPAQEVPVVVMQ
jgi:hypothetical protein